MLLLKPFPIDLAADPHPIDPISVLGGFKLSVLDHVSMDGEQSPFMGLQEIRHPTFRRLDASRNSERVCQRNRLPDPNPHLVRVMGSIVDPKDQLVTVNRLPACRQDSHSAPQHLPLVTVLDCVPTEPHRMQQIFPVLRESRDPAENLGQILAQLPLQWTLGVLRLKMPVQQSTRPLTGFDALHQSNVVPHVAGIVESMFQGFVGRPVSPRERS